MAGSCRVDVVGAGGGVRTEVRVAPAVDSLDLCTRSLLSWFCKVCGVKVSPSETSWAEHARGARHHNKHRDWVADNFPRGTAHANGLLAAPVSQSHGPASAGAVTDVDSLTVTPVTPRTPLSPAFDAELGAEVMRVYDQFRLTPEMAAARQAWLERWVEEMTQAGVRVGRAVAFGSCANGFGLREGDVDVSLESGESSRGIFGRIEQVLRRNSDRFTVQLALRNVHIPLLRFRDKQAQLDVDLSFDNGFPAYNTRMLREYSEYDVRIAALGVFVKVWSKRRELVGADIAYLSSYSWTLMVIYFLQRFPKCFLPGGSDSASFPICPVLQGGVPGCRPESAYDERGTSWDVSYASAAEYRGLMARLLVPRTAEKAGLDSLGQCVRGFFEFYDKYFDWSSGCVNIASPADVMDDKRSVHFRMHPPKPWFAVRDPFILDKDNAHAMSRRTVRQTMDEIHRANMILHEVQGSAADAIAEIIRSPC